MWAAITSSRNTYRSGPASTNRGRFSGTFTRANRSTPVAGCRTLRMSERLPLEMNGNGAPGRRRAA
jgi:hypothetical protein